MSVQSRRRLRWAAWLKPGAAEPWMVLAQAARADGADAEAIQAARRAARLAKGGPQLQQAAATLAAVGDPGGGLELLEAAAEAAPDDASLRVAVGEAWIDSGRVGEAEAAAQRALELDGRLARAHTLLGRVRERRGDGVGALAAHEAARDIAPEDLGVALARAACVARSGQPEEAARDLEGILEVHPSSVEARVSCAVAYHWAGEHAAAIDALREALRLRPGLPEAMWNLGVVLHGLGQWEAAAPLLADDRAVSWRQWASEPGGVGEEPREPTVRVSRAPAPQAPPPEPEPSPELQAEPEPESPPEPEGEVAEGAAPPEPKATSKSDRKKRRKQKRGADRHKPEEATEEATEEARAPEPQEPEPRAQEPEPQEPEPEPRTQEPEPQPQEPEPQPQEPEPQPQELEPQPQEPEPQPQEPEPREDPDEITELDLEPIRTFTPVAAPPPIPETSGSIRPPPGTGGVRFRVTNPPKETDPSDSDEDDFVDMSMPGDEDEERSALPSGQPPPTLAPRLRWLSRHGYSGALRVVSRKGVAQFEFVEGDVVAARSSDTPRLGERLVEAGKADSGAIEDCVSRQIGFPPQRLGAMLVATGDAEEEDVQAALRELLEATLAAALSWPTPRLFEDPEMPAMDGAVEVRIPVPKLLGDR